MRHLEELINRQIHRWNAMASALAHAVPGEAPKEAPPPPPPMSIAISRQVGAGARSLAINLSERLGYTIFGRDAIDYVARDLHVQRQIIDSLDERTRGEFELMLDSFLSGHEIASEEYAASLARVIRAMALKGGVILLGRGAPLVLRGSPQCLRLLMVAPLEIRIQRVAGYEHCDPSEARRMVLERDRERENCARRLYRCDPLNPLDYDLVINTDRVPVEQATDMVMSILQARGAAATAAVA